MRARNCASDSTIFQRSDHRHRISSGLLSVLVPGAGFGMVKPGARFTLNVERSGELAMARVASAPTSALVAGEERGR